MNTEKTGIKCLRKINCETKEQTVETDIILPEYYPAVSKILKISVLPDEEAVTVSADKISVAGSAAITVIYCDADNKINVYSADAKYTRVLKAEQELDQAGISVKQGVTELNYRALGPKRLDVHFTVAIAVCAVIPYNEEIISETEPEFEKLYYDTQLSEPEVICEKTVNITDSDNTAQLKYKEIKVIQNECECEIKELKPVKNKLKIQGVFKISSLCAGDGDSIFTYSREVRFTEIADVYGINEKSSCQAELRTSRVSVRFSEKGQSDIKADISIKAKFFILASSEKKIGIITDCFSVGSEAETHRKKILCYNSFSSSVLRREINEELELYNDNPAAVLCAYADNCHAELSGDEKNKKIICSCTLNAMIKSADGYVSSVARKISFETESDIPVVVCDFSGAQLSAELSNGKLYFRSNALIDVMTAEINEISAIDGISVKTECNSDCGDCVSVYFARKGEKIWNIAKNNKVRVDKLMKDNSISGKELESNAVLLISGL